MALPSQSQWSAGIRALKRIRPTDRSSLMNVGRRVDYALRALVYLAAQDSLRVVACGEIESRQAVPAHFLSKILRKLVAAGLLESVPGARGGFRLGRPAATITIRDVYEAIEGPLCLIECVAQGDEFCCFSGVCTQISVWRGAQQVLMDYLASISLEKIADPHGLTARLGQNGNGNGRRCVQPS
jgi:Rrf2 family iron-sulfur cluster assembly transcriptional regulator